MTLVTGLKHTATIPVTHQLLVPQLPADFSGFDDMPPVLATGYLVVFVEWACIQFLKPHLEPGQRSVGTYIDISHAAATPVGHAIRAEIELIEIDGRKLRFAAKCYDESDLIGEGFHERFIIDQAKFLSKLQSKVKG